MITHKCEYQLVFSDYSALSDLHALSNNSLWYTKEVKTISFILILYERNPTLKKTQLAQDYSLGSRGA